MPKKKYLIFYILFPVYFLIYAASPLIYTAMADAGTREYENADNRTESARLELFVVDLLLSNLTHHDHKSDSRAFHMLFKKNRAALSSDNLNTIEKPEINTGISRDPVTPPEIRHATVTRDPKESSKVFQKLHSGPSPPSA